MIRTNPELLTYINELYNKKNNGITEEKHNPKQRVIEQNKRYNWVYIIKKGITKCYLSDENGKDFIQEFLGEGMEFGEIEVFSGNPSFCCIEAITELVVYKISYIDFNTLLENDKKFNRLVIKAMAAKISYKAPRHSYQQSYPIEHNILRLQQLFPKLTEVISKSDIANYLGVTLRSLNRTLNQLKHRNEN
ncbi:Crp/Fnr family transcriptional regulator [Aquimarina algiphila]|uniref:Crp/Fnr family transcriptional regulator n=1 Tax=Aquimarina algiphila TaxID=2047982 RepID=UPI0024924C3D|nr:Crp/Fnr family transcriptional regulator [Aquimarina algiphila]